MGQQYEIVNLSQALALPLGGTWKISELDFSILPTSKALELAISSLASVAT
jgi:hypothetical protein